MNLTKKICLLSFSIIASLFTAQNISWKQGQKLTWDLFRSEKNISSSDALAYTMCGWSYNVTKSSLSTGSVKITITVLFDPEKSWKKDGFVNDEILKHEQNHFDIAEIFARKLRKDISEQIKTSGDFDKKFDRLFKQRFAEYQHFQEKYDTETRHGTNTEVQNQYNNLVAEMLTQNLQYSE